MIVRRQARPDLRAFVDTLWVSDEPGDPTGSGRERVLPNGAMHLVFRLSEAGLRVYDASGEPTGFGPAVVGGARAQAYVRDVSGPIRSVGAMLVPGMAEALLGASAEELAGRHTPLEDLWGGAARSVRDRLAEEADPHARLDLFESLLAARLRRVRGLHPAVALALTRFRTSGDVGGVVRESGTSHRRFIALFRRAVGLTPKLYTRIQRFSGAIARLEREPDAPFAEVALDAGYSDQAHLSREFRELAGVSPREYRRAAPRSGHHVPMLRGGPAHGPSRTSKTRR